MIQDDPLGLSLPPVSGAAGRVKQWVRDTWRLHDTVDVVVCEARCTEAGCPPRETVILLRHPDGTTEETRVHKGLGELGHDDIEELAPPERRHRKIQT